MFAKSKINLRDIRSTFGFDGDFVLLFILYLGGSKRAVLEGVRVYLNKNVRRLGLRVGVRERVRVIER